MRERNLETETNINVIIEDMGTDWEEVCAMNPDLEDSGDEAELYIFRRLITECGLSIDSANHALDHFTTKGD